MLRVDDFLLQTIAIKKEVEYLYSTSYENYYRCIFILW